MTGAPIKVLAIDDEPPIRKLLRMGLATQGYEILEAPSGKVSLEKLAEGPALIILDLGLPDIDGHELLRTIRSRNESIPIVVLSSRGDEAGKVKALDLGADDYITKPFNPRELTIRARNLLSRTMNLGTVSEERRSVDSYKFNGWELDINSRSLISPNGEQYKLPRSEFRAMLHFCENPGKIQSRAELLKKMTGRELKPHDRTVDVTIRRIRKHFESTPDTPEIIATIHGEGYRFCGDLQE